jgi:DNA-binding SARP family transcriptional activator
VKPQLDFRILGPLEIRRDGVPISIGSRRQRGLLALLLLRANRVVPADELIEQLWHPSPPATARASLQNHVSRVRKLLGEDVVETVPPGYRLNVELKGLDLARVESLLAAARGASGSERASMLREALGAWRGLPLVDFPAEPFVQSEIVRLEELRLLTLEERIEADLELEEFAMLVPELEALVEHHPLRERLWRQLMLALYGAGRQAEALATYRRAHHALVDELGLEPGQALKDVQRAILLQEPRLAVRDAPTDDLFRRAVGFLPIADSARARALLDYAQAIWRLGERSRAALALEEAAERAEAASDGILLQRVRLQQTLHATLASSGDLLGQADFANRASSAFEAAGDLDGLAEALLQESYMLRDSGAAERAATLAERAGVVAARAGNDDIRRRAGGYLAVALAVGPTPVREALVRCPAIKEGTYGVFCGRGYLLVQAGEIERGTALVERGVDIARELRLPSSLAGAMHWVAFLHETTGDIERASDALRAAYDLADATGERGGVASASARLARVLAAVGEIDEAERFADEAASLAQRSDFSVIVYEQLARALIQTARGQHHEARESATNAMAVVRQSDWLNLQALVQEDLVTIAPDPTAARNEARALYDRKGNRAASARL